MTPVCRISKARKGLYMIIPNPLGQISKESGTSERIIAKRRQKQNGWTACAPTSIPSDDGGLEQSRCWSLFTVNSYLLHRQLNGFEVLNLRLWNNGSEHNMRKWAVWDGSTQEKTWLSRTRLSLQTVNDISNSKEFWIYRRKRSPHRERDIVWSFRKRYCLSRSLFK